MIASDHLSWPSLQLREAITAVTSPFYRWTNRLDMKPVRDTAGCEPKLHHHPAPGSICHSVTTQPPPGCCQIHLHMQHLPFPGHTHPTLAGLSLRPAQIHSTAPLELLSFPSRQRSIPSTGVKVGMKLLG